MQLASLDLNLLLVFEALFEERSVTVAARRLGLGQPGMSAALGRLRKLLADDLFVRVRGEMRPSAKAAELAPGIAAALAQIRRTLEAGVGFDPATAARSFTIGSTDYASLVLLPRLVAWARQTAPRVDLRVVGYEKGAVPEMLDKGELTIALGVFPKPPDRAVIRELFSERFIGVARRGHPAIDRGRLALRTFASLPHALVTARRDATGAIDEALARHGLTRRVALALPYALALPAVLAGSDLVAAVASRLADRIVSDGRLQLFELPVEVPAWTLSMLWPATARGDPAAAWLREAVLTCVRTEAASDP